MVWPASPAGCAAASADIPSAPVAEPRPASVPVPGANFSATDFLGLIQHPEVRQTVQWAINQYGVANTAWTPFAGMQNAGSVLATELGELLQMAHVSLFPSGWTAGFGAVRSIIHASDHVVLDALTQIGFYEGAAAATRQVHLCRHLDVGHLRATLQSIRHRETQRSTVLVVTEALFAADAAAPDLRAMQSVCAEFEALLCVSVAYDLAAIGPGGTGQLGLQNMLGKVDVVVGSFSPTLASGGGFVAALDRVLAARMQQEAAGRLPGGATGTAQLVTALAALRIARSEEGERLRRDLLVRVAHVRSAATARGGIVLGSAAPMVPLLVGWEDVCHEAVRLCAGHGIMVQLLEHPEVPVATARLRLNVSATMAEAPLAPATMRIMESIQEAERHFDAANLPPARP